MHAVREEVFDYRSRAGVFEEEGPAESVLMPRRSTAQEISEARRADALQNDLSKMREADHYFLRPCYRHKPDLL